MYRSVTESDQAQSQGKRTLRMVEGIGIGVVLVLILALTFV
jgi:hypothetical protein